MFSPEEVAAFDLGLDDKTFVPPVSGDTISPLDIGDADFSHLPPRQWLYGTSSLIGMLSAVCGNGGSGKTSIEIAKAMSVAIGRSLLGLDEYDDSHRVHRQGNVLYWNLEDSEEEMLKRIYAEMRHRGVRKSELAGKFFVLSGRDKRLEVAVRDDRKQPRRTDLNYLIDLLRSLNIVLLVVDPLVNSHGLKENDNDEQNLVIDQFRQIAHQAGCAVVLVHHFRKGGEAADGEAGRGAVAVHAGVRVMETVVTMTAKDAEALGVPAKDRRRYVRSDNAKSNLSAGTTETQWFRFVSVPLGNGTPDYPLGDNVGVLERWVPQNAMFGTSWEQLEAVLDEIDEGVDGEYYLKTPQAKMSIGKLLKRHFPTWQDKQVVNQAKDWIASGLLKEVEYKSPANYKTYERLISTPAGREAAKNRMAARA